MTTAPKVTVIPSKPKLSTVAKEPTQKLKVAAYCRVSTEHEEQESSYETQCSHYQDYISSNPEWELAGIYADDGISGLAANKRPEFQRLIDDCMSGKVQMVITKSISRFARNTLDCLNYIRKLKEKGIPILFEKENILTTDAKGEILITIMASIAQQESASISQNVQMGLHYRYQQGKVGGGHNRFLGYVRTQDASLAIVPEEAPIVRRIFREYIEGRSPNQIAKGLTEDHVTWRWNQDGVWTTPIIRYVIENEKYTGTLLLQKYYTVDFLTKKVARNRGQVPQYLIENNHPPIIPQEVFLQAKAQKALKTSSFNQQGYHPRANYNNIFLSGKLICSHCGSTYVRKKEKQGLVWRCGTKAFNKSECDGRPLAQNDVQAAIVEALNRLPEEETNLVRLEDHFNMAKPEQDAEATYRLLHIHNALEKIRSLRGESLTVEETDPACTDYDDFLRRTNTDSRVGEVKEYTDYEAFRYIERVIVHPDHLEVVFKAGVSINVDK